MASLEDDFANLHAELGKLLLKRVKSGTATPSELNVARQFLKDNGIDDIPRAESPLDALKDLPIFDDDDPRNLKH